eukprot:scaffold1744_cov340-Prasinococcus_capsulatus_cf.AAC.5
MRPALSRPTPPASLTATRRSRSPPVAAEVSEGGRYRCRPQCGTGRQAAAPPAATPRRTPPEPASCPRPLGRHRPRRRHCCHLAPRRPGRGTAARRRCAEHGPHPCAAAPLDRGPWRCRSPASLPGSLTRPPAAAHPTRGGGCPSCRGDATAT